MYQVDRIAHLEETITDNDPSEDLIWFIGVQACGDSSRVAPTTFGPFLSNDGEYQAIGIVDGGETYLIAFRKDPTAGLGDSTFSIDFTGMSIGSGTKINILGVEEDTDFQESISGNTLTMTAGSGSTPNVGKSLIIEA